MSNIAEAIIYLSVLLAAICCIGEPDIIDGIAYQLTGVKVWEGKLDSCGKGE